MASSCARARASSSSARRCAPSRPAPSVVGIRGRRPRPGRGGRIRTQSSARAPARAQEPPRQQRRVPRAARLQRVPPCDVVVAAAHVVELTTDRRTRKLVGDCRRRIRDARNSQRLREERVAVEDRRRFVEPDVRGRVPRRDRRRRARAGRRGPCRRCATSRLPPPRAAGLSDRRAQPPRLRDRARAGSGSAATVEAVNDRFGQRAQLIRERELREVRLDQVLGARRGYSGGIAAGLLELGLDLLRGLLRNLGPGCRWPRPGSCVASSFSRVFSSCSKSSARLRASSANSCDLLPCDPPEHPVHGRPASSDAYRFASVTASSIATSTGTSRRSSFLQIPIRRTFRSSAPRRSAGNPRTAAAAVGPARRPALRPPRRGTHARTGRPRPRTATRAAARSRPTGSSRNSAVRRAARRPAISRRARASGGPPPRGSSSNSDRRRTPRCGARRAPRTPSSARQRPRTSKRARTRSIADGRSVSRTITFASSES